MALRRVTIEMPSEVLVPQGVDPRVFFDYNESVEIVRVEDGGRAYISPLRQRNPGVLEARREEFGAGVTPTTPSVIGRDVATLSFLADDETAKRVFALLDGVGV